MALTFVVKTSKLCNLRCTYCYETNELAQKDFISLENIDNLFAHTIPFCESSRNDATFVWHGGEPLLRPPAYWQEVLDIQKKYTDGLHIKIHNVIQTNLTHLPEAMLPLLKNHFHVGFSYDVRNQLRVNMGGQQVDEAIFKNLQRLKDYGITTSGIAVISKNNIQYPIEVASFFASHHLGARFLNIYQNIDGLEQIKALAVPLEDYLDFLNMILEEPSFETAIKDGSFQPFAQSFKLLTESDIKLTRTSSSQMAILEWVLGVNTDGNTCDVGDMYIPEYFYGNIFKEDLTTMMASVGRMRRIHKSFNQIQKTCSGCPFFQKSCTGIYVSHSTAEEYREFERLGGCYNRFTAEMMAKRWDIDIQKQMTFSDSDETPVPLEAAVSG